MKDLLEKFLNMLKRVFKNGGFCIVILLALCCYVLYLKVAYTFFADDSDEVVEPEKIEYTEFESWVRDNKVSKIEYSLSREYMTVYLHNDETKEMTLEEREEYEYPTEDTYLVLFPANEDFRVNMLRHNIVLTVMTDTTANIAAIISNMFTISLMVLWVIMIMRMLGRGSLNNKDLIQKSDKKFADVIGHDEVLEDIKFITDFIENPHKGDNIGAKVPKGILFSGEPGTGKTLIAKAIAGEAGVPFIYMNASSFIEMYVGVGAKRVRELFKVARKNSPCIVFIDEIDAIGGERGTRGDNSERTQTINALLQEMDGFSGREGVFIIGATNLAETLDKALTRTGRFDRQVVINRPRDWKVRKELFEFYLNKLSVSDDINIDNISKQTTGFTGSDIETICNEAGLIAMQSDKEFVDNDCLEEAIDKHIFKGNRSKKEGMEKDKLVVAYHEAGHAVMHYILDLPVSRASIIANTSGVGGVVFGQEQDEHLITKEMFEKRIKIMYAGRASESIKFGDVTTGASNDIAQATQLLKQYIGSYGFDDETGLVNVDTFTRDDIVLIEENFERAKILSKELYASCHGLLNEKYDLVECLAQNLLEQETMSGEDIKVLLDRADGKVVESADVVEEAVEE